MRKVTYGGAASLDLYIAGPNEEIDWLRWTKDSAALAGAGWKGVDTILMGRKTWDFAVRSGGDSGMAGASKMQTFIFSRTMTEAPAGAHLVRDDAVGFVRALKDAPGGDIIILGGGELGSALIEGGLVDEIRITLHPLLLGSGIPMFRPLSSRVQLSLIEARPIAEDCVFVRYRVENG